MVDENHDGKWVNDSWEIAKYLEKTYPDQPSLFKGTSGVSSCFTPPGRHSRMKVQDQSCKTVIPCI